MTQNQSYNNKKYFHIGIYFAEVTLDKELEYIFNNYSDDWIRYASNCWIIYTKHTSEEILNLLRNYLSSRDQVLILEVVKNQQLSGWLPQWIWSWLNKERL